MFSKWIRKFLENEISQKFIINKKIASTSITSEDNQGKIEFSVQWHKKFLTNQKIFLQYCI